MMEKWKEHESQCVNYLKENYETEEFAFVVGGGSDPTVSDIKVQYSDTPQSDFYIEAKMPSAQAGQFVLIADWNKKIFVYSSRNKSPENHASKEFIKYMNDNFEYFANAGTKGVSVDIDKSFCYEWIINHYNDLGAYYFITKIGDEFVITPIEDMEKYYDVEATYRIKKSGSGNLSGNNISDLRQALCNYDTDDVIISCDEGKVYVKTKADLAYKKLAGEKYTYYFKPIDGKYYVRKLSNTANANIIFSVYLKTNRAKYDTNEFRSLLNKGGK